MQRWSALLISEPNSRPAGHRHKVDVRFLVLLSALHNLRGAAAITRL
jgi:hypothetical protein